MIDLIKKYSVSESLILPIIKVNAIEPVKIIEKVTMLNLFTSNSLGAFLSEYIQRIIGGAFECELLSDEVTKEKSMKKTYEYYKEDADSDEQKRYRVSVEIKIHEENKSDLYDTYEISIDIKEHVI